MRVFGINSGYDGCCYVRLYLPFSNNGWPMDKMNRRSDRISIEGVRKELEQADVVVFHRAEEQEYHNLAKLLKADGKKIVMDNDDTFKIEGYHPLAQFKSDGTYVNSLEKREKNIEDFLRLCDLATVSTPMLKKEYDKFCDNVVVLPNCVEPDDWDEPLKNTGKKIRIGITGSAAMENDYKHIKHVIKELSERKDVTFVLFGLGDLKHRKDNPRVTKVFSEEYAFWDSIDHEQFPWVKNYDYQRTLNEARLDIMIIPRVDNYFNRCKSNIKFLEASMLEIPVVAQSFDGGPYEEIENMVTGIKIRDDSEWMKHLDFLIKNKSQRQLIGKQAKEYVLKNYNINDHANRWRDEYLKLCAK